MYYQMWFYYVCSIEKNEKPMVKMEGTPKIVRSSR